MVHPEKLIRVKSPFVFVWLGGKREPSRVCSGQLPLGEERRVTSKVKEEEPR